MPLTKINTVLVDTNVWLDYFMGEGPELEAIKELVRLAHEGCLTLLYAPTTAKDLFYLIPRRLRRLVPEDNTSYAPAAWGCIEKLMEIAVVPEDNTSYAPAAWGCIEKLMEIAVAAPLSFPECELARMLRKAFDDFEDNLVLAAAETAKADYVVTQDRAFLSAMPEVCITPSRALELLRISRR